MTGWLSMAALAGGVVAAGMRVGALLAWDSVQDWWAGR